MKINQEALKDLMLNVDFRKSLRTATLVDKETKELEKVYVYYLTKNHVIATRRAIYLQIVKKPEPIKDSQEVICNECRKITSYTNYCPHCGKRLKE